MHCCIVPLPELADSTPRDKMSPSMLSALPGAPFGAFAEPEPLEPPPPAALLLAEPVAAILQAGGLARVALGVHGGEVFLELDLPHAHGGGAPVLFNLLEQFFPKVV